MVGAEVGGTVLQAARAIADTIAAADSLQWDDICGAYLINV
jgi:hypothetical protein